MKKVNDVYMYVLGAIVVLGLIAITCIMIWVPIPPENENIIYMISGIFGAAFATVVGYFYGSSKGSKEKTEILKQNNKS
jgi:dolichol kinase